MRKTTLAAMALLMACTVHAGAQPSPATTPISAQSFPGVRLPARTYSPGVQVVVPDPWGRPMRLQFMSFASTQFHGSVFLQVQDDPNGLPADSRITADSFGHAGNVILLWQSVIDPAGRTIWTRAPTRRPVPPR